MSVHDDHDARLRRRAEDTRRWRSRCRRAVSLYQIEVDSEALDLAIQFGALKETQITNKHAVNAALGRLLRRALAALLREDGRSQIKE